MEKRSPLIIAATALALLVMLAWAGCGGGDSGTATEGSATDNAATADTDTTESSTGSGTPGNFQNQMNELEDLEATVEVSQNGEVLVIWSQKQGSWRWQDPTDETSYVIYNNVQDKLWIVDGNTATESSGVGAQGQSWWGMSPAAMLQAFALFPGSQSGDTWQINVPGGGSVTIELKGPQGLPTKMEVKAPGEEDEVIEFAYKNVGNVPDDLFILPSSVTVTELSDIEGLENIQVPDVNIPNR